MKLHFLRVFHYHLSMINHFLLYMWVEDHNTTVKKIQGQQLGSGGWGTAGAPAPDAETSSPRGASSPVIWPSRVQAGSPSAASAGYGDEQPQTRQLLTT